MSPQIPGSQAGDRRFLCGVLQSEAGTGYAGSGELASTSGEYLYQTTCRRSMKKVRAHCRVLLQCFPIWEESFATTSGEYLYQTTEKRSIHMTQCLCVALHSDTDKIGYTEKLGDNFRWVHLPDDREMQMTQCLYVVLWFWPENKIKLF